MLVVGIGPITTLTSCDERQLRRWWGGGGTEGEGTWVFSSDHSWLSASSSQNESILNPMLSPTCLVDGSLPLESDSMKSASAAGPLAPASAARAKSWSKTCLLQVNISTSMQRRERRRVLGRRCVVAAVVVSCALCMWCGHGRMSMSARRRKSRIGCLGQRGRATCHMLHCGYGLEGRICYASTSSWDMFGSMQ